MESKTIKMSYDEYKSMEKICNEFESLLHSDFIRADYYQFGVPIFYRKDLSEMVENFKKADEDNQDLRLQRATLEFKIKEFEGSIFYRIYKLFNK